MANDVVFTVEGKGKNLKKTANEAGDIGKNVDKSNAALDKAGGKQDAYNRREKGIYQTNLSSGKAYSKLAQNIGGGGSSSLVGAYATLAANIFALTAAFNALRSASQFEQLVQGLNAVGDAAGRNLTHLGEKLQDVTGHAISAERAMRAVAIGTSAGFSAEQLTKLTTVARGASIALGRDMGDAMDRLIRGAAKLEPEILDELGIMVRLDDATEDYATTLNKTAGQLTQYERRMAFVTAINEQGLEKFEGIAKAVDPTPYDQLAASLDNLMKVGLGLVNTFLTPMVNLMANSTGVLVGSIAMFGSTISRQMLPFLHDTATKARQAADQFAKMNTVSREGIVTTGALPPKYKKLSKSIVDGTASMEEMQVVQKELANSEKHRAGQLRNLDEQQDPAKYAKVKAGLDNVRKSQTELTKVTEGHLGALARTRAADAMTMTSLSDMPQGWKKLNEAIDNNNQQIDLNIEAEGRSEKAKDKASKAAFKYGQRIKFIGAGIMQALPWIGLIITAIGLLSAAWDKFFPEDKLKAATDEAMKAFDRIDEITKALVKGTVMATDSVTILANQYRALAGVVATSRDVVSGISEAILESQVTAIEAEVEKLLTAQKALKNFKAQKEDEGGGIKAAIRITQNTIRDALSAIDRLKDDVGKFDDNALMVLKKGVSTSIAKMQMFSKANDDIATTEVTMLQNILARIGTDGDDAITNVEELSKAMKEMSKPSQAFQAAVDGAAQTMGEFLKATAKMGQVATTPFDAALRSLQTISTEMSTIDDKAEAAGQAERDRLERQLGKGHKQQKWVDREALTAEINERNNLFKVLKKNYNLEETLGVKTRAGFEKYKKNIQDSVEALRKKAGVIKRLKQIEKDTASFAKSQFISRELATKEEFKSSRTRINAEIAYNEEAIKTNKSLLLRGKLARFEELSKIKTADLTGKQRDELESLTELVKSNAKLEADIVALKDEELKLDLELKQVAVARAEDDMAALKITQQMVGLERQRINLLKTQESARAQIAAIKDPIRRGQGRENLSPAEEYALFLKREARERKAITDEHKIKSDMIKAEETLLKAKVELNKMEAELLRQRIVADDPSKEESARATYDAFVKSADDYVTAMTPLFKLRIDVADLERDVARDNLNLEKERLGLASRRGQLGAMESAMGDRKQGGGTGIAGVDLGAGLRAGVRERRAEIKGVRDAAADKWEKGQKKGIEEGMITPTGVKEGRKAAADEAQKTWQAAIPPDTLTEKMTFLRTATAGMTEELKKLGPEGEVAAAVVEGSMAMGDGFAHIVDTFGTEGATKMEKGAAIASAIASTIAATANIMAAASRARIAGIDKEIAAEQKRDGKSKQSLAKIKALEAKKAQMQKKAFEMNKKMQMASVVASTAAAMMSAMVSATMYEKPLGFILAGIIGAMGAAQLAIIAGLSYQGGSGGISAPGAPAAISMGERSNKVDIAGGRGNTGGELAYLRGARGSGSGAHDFRPAFAGRKYRAAGGAAYVVGEQGPELFVPSVPGQVVANDDINENPSAGTVNFTINALDSAGVEEVLIGQRGNIIGMIRESANEYGTDFLEEVDTETYTDITEGSVYGRA